MTRRGLVGSDGRVTFVEKQQAVAAELARCRNAPERLAWLIARARHRPGLDPSARLDAQLVPGCLSKLWLSCACEHGRCRFACDSESNVVRAVAGLLCELASGCAPEELVAVGAAGPIGLGLERWLAPNRRAAQARVWEHMVTFAAAQVAALRVG